MKAMTRTLTTLALFAACAACNDTPTGSSAFAAPADGPALAQSQPTGELTFSWVKSYTDETPQTATGATASIDFTGSLTTGQPCYTIAASHTVRNGEVILTVEATRTADICTYQITRHNYQGSVAGLAPGTYTFSVIHIADNTRTNAFTGTVVVQ